MVNKDLYKDFRLESGFIKDEHILDIPMGKANKRWIEIVQEEGYTIIDVGYPKGVTSDSPFYNMEINTIKW